MIPTDFYTAKQVKSPGIFNEAWCDWLMSQAIGTRRAVLADELRYFDAWVKGEMTRDEIIEDAVR